MMDWDSGQPNARYWALKLLIDNSGPGDRQVETTCDLQFITAQAYITPQNKRKILLVNKRDRPFEVTIPGINGSAAQYVDQKTGFHPPASRTLTADTIVVQGLAVTVITLKD